MGKQEIKRIISQLEQLHNKNWTGLNLYEILNEITDQTANLELPNFNHTIHQIARHLVTDFVVLKRLQGIDYKISPQENWIPAKQINCKWADTVNALKENKNALISELQNLPDERLDEPILKNHTSIYENLHGFIQHAYYHFGQIVLMKKFIDNMHQ
jgi:uncharacterized damage-inducible protein DinB